MNFVRPAPRKAKHPNRITRNGRLGLTILPATGPDAVAVAQSRIGHTAYLLAASRYSAGLFEDIE